MNPGRFFMPGYVSSMPTSASMMGLANAAPRSMGLFSKITSGIRSVNWGSLLTNANKTLDVVNQTIPLVRQAGPMFNNMKSMFRIAKAFGSETASRGANSNIVNNQNNNTVNSDVNLAQKKEVIENNSPNFFV